MPYRFKCGLILFRINVHNYELNHVTKFLLIELKSTFFKFFKKNGNDLKKNPHFFF